MIGHKPRKLTGVNHEYEAELIAAALYEHGIESHVVGGVMADFRAECPAVVEVMVAEEDIPAAAEVLKQLDKSPPEIDWDRVDVGDPTTVPEAGAGGFDPLRDRLPEVFVIGALLLVAALYFSS